MAQLTYSVTITRWQILRLVPGCWVQAVRSVGVSPWHPLDRGES